MIIRCPSHWLCFVEALGWSQRWHVVTQRTRLCAQIYSVKSLNSVDIPYTRFIASTIAAMGVDAGFDMVPRLSKGAVDRQNWQSFVEFIKEHYQNDDLVEVKPNYIVFKAGEHPLLPFEGHKFLRFSSKISGSQTKGVEKYLDTVTQVAKVRFGSRVRAWNEAADERGVYNWQEVRDSFQSYEQVCHGLLTLNIGLF